MGLIEQVEQCILQNHLLERRQAVVVAASGGVDSIVLLDALFRLAPRYEWKLTVAHLNHQLRGTESDRDQLLVETVAQHLGLSCVTGRADVRLRQKEEGLSMEMAARRLRHEFLARTAGQIRAKTIALGHHANDQVELFFLRLLRGAGGSGLRGMQWESPSPANSQLRLIRPLLELPKKTLETYALDHQLRFVQDSSNLDRKIFRNQIRHELIPLLIANYQPGLLQQIRRSMDIIGQEASAVSREAQTWLARKKRPVFARLPIAVQRQILWWQLRDLQVEPRFDWIEQLRCHPPIPVTLQPGLVLQLSPAGELHPAAAPPAPFNQAYLAVELGGGSGEIRLGQHWIHWQLFPHRPSFLAARKNQARASASADRGIEFFDADKVGPRIRLRHWQPGDRFRPIGMAVSAKLQNLLTNLKIPREGRMGLLLGVAASGELFWVERLRIGDVFKLDKTTQQCLKWEWQRLPGGDMAAKAEEMDD